MTQWKPAGLPFYSRSHAAPCWDAPLARLHVLGGWHGTSYNSTGGVLLNESWRSSDFLTAERSLVPGLPGLSYFSAAAHNGTVLASPGYDGPLPPDGGDNVNDLVHASTDGGLNFSALSPAIEPHEHGWLGLLAPGSGDFAGICGGLKYVSGGYHMNRNSYVVRDDLTIELRNDDFPYLRRGFGCAMWNGHPTAYGGINDEAGGTATHNDATVFLNGMRDALQVATGCAPGSMLGHAVEVLNGRYVIACGSWYGVRYSGADPKWHNTAAVWSTNRPADEWDNPNAWVRHADYPGGELNGMSLVSVVKDGVPKLLALGGRDATGHSVPNLRETTDLENWTDLTASDLRGV